MACEHEQLFIEFRVRMPVAHNSAHEVGKASQAFSLLCENTEFVPCWGSLVGTKEDLDEEHRKTLNWK